MKEWSMKLTMNCQVIPKQFQMCYKGFCVENNLLMYSPHLTTRSHPVLFVSRLCSTQILEMFHDNVEARHPGEIESTSPYVDSSGFPWSRILPVTSRQGKLQPTGTSLHQISNECRNSKNISVILNKLHNKIKYFSFLLYHDNISKY